MLGDTFEVLVLFGTAVVMAFVGHSRSTRYERTSLLVGVLSAAVWFAVIVARHHSPTPLLAAFLSADPLVVLLALKTVTAAVCSAMIAHAVSLFFGVGGKNGVGLGVALLAFLLIVFMKACVASTSGGPVDPL